MRLLFTIDELRMTIQGIRRYARFRLPLSLTLRSPARRTSQIENRNSKIKNGSALALQIVNRNSPIENPPVFPLRSPAAF